MKQSITRSLVVCALWLCSANVFAAMEDDPLLTMLKLDQLEARDTDEDTITAWQGHFWAGKDLDKLWFKTEGERTSGETERAEFQLLYSRAIDPYWDIQFGLRHDEFPDLDRDWGVVGFYGVSPYWFEIDTALFIGENGQTSLRFEAEYEWMLSQQLVLSPEVEVNLFGKDDSELGIGAGFSDIEAGLRLRYEVYREFAPYIGVNWERLLGDSADIAKAAGADTDETQLVMGLRFWF